MAASLKYFIIQLLPKDPSSATCHMVSHQDAKGPAIQSRARGHEGTELWKVLQKPTSSSNWQMSNKTWYIQYGGELVKICLHLSPEYWG